MKTSKSIKKVVKPVVLALSALFVSAAVNAAPTWTTKPTTDWKVAQTTDSAIRVSNQVAAGTLHAVCSAKGCDLFIEPQAGCSPGTTYPVLINSARHMGVVPARCVLVLQNNEPSLIAHLARTKELMPAIARGEDISLAFPTQAGAMNVLNIRMAGVAKLLANAMRKAGIGRSAEHKPETSAKADTKAAENAAIASAVANSKMRYQI